MAANGYGVSFWDDKGVLKFIVVIVAQVCEYTKNHRTVHFKDTQWELYLSKAVIKKKFGRISKLGLWQRKYLGRRVMENLSRTQKIISAVSYLLCLLVNCTAERHVPPNNRGP